MQGGLALVLLLPLWGAACVPGADLVEARQEVAEPDRPAAWSALGDALMQRHRESERPEDLAAAAAAYREALRRDDVAADAFLGLAWVHGVEHEFEASIGWAERALASDSGDARAHGVLGDAALELGDLGRAAHHYQVMLDLQPGLASYARAAQLLERQGRHGEAQAMMQRAIAAGGTAPEHVAWCRAQLALMLWRSGALAEAEQVLAVAIRETPGHTDVLLATGTLRAARGDTPGAIAAYQQLVARTPLPAALASLGDLYTLAGHPGVAQSHYDRAEAALRAHSRHGAHAAEGDLALARFLADHDRDLETALAQARAAYRARPTARAAEAVAWSLHKLGRNEEAARMIGIALEAGAPGAERLFHAALVHAALGEEVEAKRLSSEALQLNPAFHPLKAEVAVRLLAGNPMRSTCDVRRDRHAGSGTPADQSSSGSSRISCSTTSSKSSR